MSDIEKSEKITAIVRNIVENSPHTFKQINKMITDKEVKFKHQISKLAAAKIISKELNIEMPTNKDKKGKDSPKESKDIWETVGYFSSEELKFKWKKEYQELLGDLQPRVDQVNDLLRGNSDWEIVGSSELNRTEKGSAVFARKTKSGSGIGMYVGKNYIFISEKLWNREMEFMPVSMIQKGENDK